jgi:hypothetical protein
MKWQLLFLASFTITQMAYCQLFHSAGKQAGAKHIKGGIKAGVALANCQISYDPEPDPSPGKTKAKMALAAGFFARFQLNKNTCFQPELLFIGKGLKQKDPYNFTYRSRFSYLELPLNILYRPETSRGAFFIGGGPAPSFHIGQNSMYSGNYLIKTFDIGVNVLAGYEIPIGFSINLHYTHGLSNISKSNDDFNNPYVSKLKNRCFGLTIGYVF